MATVTVTNFYPTLRPGNKVLFTTEFSISRTATEQRLGIPIKVWIRIMERDGKQDKYYPFYDSSMIRPGQHNDDSATGWMFVGTYNDDGSWSHNKVMSRSSLPKEIGNEEWYCAAYARPDIVADLGYFEADPVSLS